MTQKPIDLVRYRAELQQKINAIDTILGDHGSSSAKGNTTTKGGRKPWSEAAKKYALGPTRVQFQNKDPRGWAEFARQLLEHAPKGQALTMRGVQMRRPSLWELVGDMKRIDVPALIVTGDEDDPCLEPALLMKRNIATAGLVVLPWSGHTINIEEPDAFNRALFDFFMRVDEGRSARRDPRSSASGILGFRK